MTPIAKILYNVSGLSVAAMIGYRGIVERLYVLAAFQAVRVQRHRSLVGSRSVTLDPAVGSDLLYKVQSLLDDDVNG